MKECFTDYFLVIKLENSTITNCCDYHNLIDFYTLNDSIFAFKMCAQLSSDRTHTTNAWTTLFQTDFKLLNLDHQHPQSTNF